MGGLARRACWRRAMGPMSRADACQVITRAVLALAQAPTVPSTVHMWEQLAPVCRHGSCAELVWKGVQDFPPVNSQPLRVQHSPCCCVVLTRDVCLGGAASQEGRDDGQEGVEARVHKPNCCRAATVSRRDSSPAIAGDSWFEVCGAGPCAPRRRAFHAAKTERGLRNHLPSTQARWAADSTARAPRRNGMVQRLCVAVRDTVDRRRTRAFEGTKPL
jgi:hypothetical protein